MIHKIAAVGAVVGYAAYLFLTTSFGLFVWHVAMLGTVYLAGCVYAKKQRLKKTMYGSE